MKKNNQYFSIIFFLLAGSVFSSEFNWKKMSELENKPAEIYKTKMIYFSAEWCGWCKKLEADVLSESDVNSYINENYEAFKLDLDDKNKIDLNGHILTAKELAAKMGIKTFPTIVFLDENNNPLGHLKGYYKREDFMKALKYINLQLSEAVSK